MTNFERIKNMTVEEMIDFIDRCQMYQLGYGMSDCGLGICEDLYDCRDCKRKWLESEAEE